MKLTLSDRELLEMAARAAGVELSFGEEGVLYRVLGEKYFRGRWNPLTDDGDALRLAVKLGLTISTRPKRGGHGTIVWTYSVPQQSEPHGTDPMAATRRAIVRAAASIGSAAGERP